MHRRILMMAGLWAIISAVLYLGGIFGGRVLLALVAMGAMTELSGLIRRIGYPVSRVALVGSVAAILFGHIYSLGTLGVGTAILLTTVAHLRSPPLTLLFALVAMGITACGFGSLLSIVDIRLTYPLLTALWVIATIKMSDANAYLIGSQFGRSTIALQISPKKSYEGLAGALLGGALMGIVGAPLWPHLPHPILFSVLLGVLLAFVGAVGDFAESALKRRAGVKDSGNILPGIGGLLDLTDSLILAAPVAYFVLQIFSI